LGSVHHAFFSEEFYPELHASPLLVKKKIQTPEFFSGPTGKIEKNPGLQRQGILLFDFLTGCRESLWGY
jgi:hypothetical protein